MAFSLKFTTQKKLSDELQIRFLNRLKQFLLNGYSLQHALEAISWDKELAATSNLFLDKLQRGHKLDDIFSEAGFHPSVSSFLCFVQPNSNLLEAITKCTDMMEQRFNQIKRFKLILRYPIILLILFIFILFFINHHVLPSFQSLFSGSKSSLYGISLLIQFMELFQFLILIFFLLLLLILLLWRQFKKRLPIEEQLKIIQHIPILSRYIRLKTSFQFAMNFSMLLKTGLPLKEILSELAYQDKLPIISHYAVLLEGNLNRGVHFGMLLEELFFIENELGAIFQKNATVDMLERDLSLYSDLLLENLQRMIFRVISWIQPTVYIFLGIFIIFIYLSLMWPMLEMLKSI